jgi:leucyl aminopeptidase
MVTFAPDCTPTDSIKEPTMKLVPSTADVTAFGGGLLAVGRFAGEAPGAAEKALDAALDGALARAAERLRFAGKTGQSVKLDTLGRLPATRLMVVGLGDRAKVGPNTLRDAAAAAVDEALSGRLETVGFVAPDLGDAPRTARLLAEGAQLGAYRFDELKRVDPDDPPAKVTQLSILGGDDVAGALRLAETYASAVNLARTLVNEPPNLCTPTRLAEVASRIAADGGLSLTVMGPDELRARGMGGILGVSAGATEPPRLIHLTWKPKAAVSAEGGICIVGKGLTFDSGGLSLKPPKGMETMHIDMAGAAAVLGAMQIVAAQHPGVPVHGIIGACENMPDGSSYRPSDVLKMYSGKTVEVLNTDAEGRLVLADCLWYATELKPRLIVDLATLTGACMVALGDYYAGLFTDKDDVADELLASAGEAGERLWRLPLDPKLAPQLKSPRADLKNIGGPYGGAITAALFLKEFVGDTPWAHLDIAGPAHTEKPDGHVRVGGTGFGVLTLWRLIERAASR